MVPEITAALAAAQNAMKIAKGIQQVSRDVEINGKVIELQQSILDLQTQIFATQAKMDELAQIKDEVTAQLKAKDDWEQEKQRYEAIQVGVGLMVYALKKEHATKEPFHYLCPNCYQKGQKRLLQRPKKGFLNYKCHDCGFDMVKD